MFQKGSFSIPSDSSGIHLVKIMQTRRCSTRKHAQITHFLRVIIRRTKPILRRRRKKKLRAIVIRSQANFRRNDGLIYTFYDNALILLKRRMNTVGKELYGPTGLALKIRKFRIAFRYVF